MSTWVTRSRCTTSRGLGVHLVTATAVGRLYAVEGNSSPEEVARHHVNTVVIGNWTACSLACFAACKWGVWRVLPRAGQPRWSRLPGGRIQMYSLETDLKCGISGRNGEYGSIDVRAVPGLQASRVAEATITTMPSLP